MGWHLGWHVHHRLRRRDRDVLHWLRRGDRDVLHRLRHGDWDVLHRRDLRRVIVVGLHCRVGGLLRRLRIIGHAVEATSHPESGLSNHIGLSNLHGHAHHKGRQF